MDAFVRKFWLTIFPLMGTLLLSSCSDEHHKIHQTQSFSNRQSLQKQSTELPAMQKEEPQSRDRREPATNEYNTNPPQARYPYPPIPDASDVLPKESQ